MDTYDPTNEYDILLMIFRFIRDYDTATATLAYVTKQLLWWLNAGGDDARMIDDRQPDFRTVEVNGHRYRIIRNPGWSHYEVRRTA